MHGWMLWLRDRQDGVAYRVGEWLEWMARGIGWVNRLA